MADETKPFAPAPDPKVNRKEDLAGATVLMSIPQPITLRLPNNNLVTFQPGVREVPASLKDHWWLRAHGAQLFSGKAAPTVNPVGAPSKPPDYDQMTKVELVAHASEVHQLELDPNQKKDDLIAAIKDAAAKP